MKLYILIPALFILLAAPVQANPDGIIVRLAPIHANASSTSPQIGQLSAGIRVNIFGRKGGWKEIYSEEKSIVGWVRSYQVREGNYTKHVQQETQEDSRGFLSGLASLSRKASRFFTTGDSNTSSGTATIGVRGLSEEQIKLAQPDFDELAKMQQYSSNQSRLDKFKLNGYLRANDVKHITLKKKKKSSSGAGNLNK